MTLLSDNILICINPLVGLFPAICEILHSHVLPQGLFRLLKESSQSPPSAREMALNSGFPPKIRVLGYV